MNNYSIDEINQVLYENIDVLLVVDSTEDSYYAVKRTESFAKFIEQKGSYKGLIEKLLFHMNDSEMRIADTYQVFLPKMGEFKRKFSRKIRVEIGGVKHIIQMLVYPIKTYDGDYIILLFDLGQSEVEQNNKKESKVKTIQETYLFSMLVDLNRDSVSSMNVKELSDDDLHYDVKYSEWRMMIVNAIWPEDQEMFLTVTGPEYLKEHLKPSKTISIDCQMKNLEGIYIWVKLIFGRTDTVGEQDFRFVFMVQNIHEDSLKLFNELKKFEKLASNDALTGIFNHGRIETELSSAIESLKKDDSPVSLMMFDIDFFKRINDTYGHAVGDEVLKAFVKSISSKLERHNIKMGRWGGEEFVCVCYGFDVERLQTLAEEVRTFVANQPSETVVPITCSIGVSPVNKEDSIKDAFMRLDKALYNAKNNGRNCVSL